MKRLILALCTLSLAGCGVIAQQLPNPTNGIATAPPTQYVPPPTEPPTAPPTANSATVGATVTTTTGATYTVIVYRAHLRSNNPYNTPPPGGYFSAANVKECAPSDATLDANPFDWSLGLSDDSRVQPDAPPEELNGTGPALHATSLSAGRCVSGWVGFGVPAGAAPTQVLVDGADFYWTL